MLSRVADSLFWMSRYLERAEYTARLVDVNLNLSLDQGPESGAEHQQLLLRSLNISPEKVLAEDESDSTLPDVTEVARRLTFDARNPNSIVSCIATARENARQVREQISTEMYEQINRLYLHLRAPDIEESWNQSSHEFYESVMDGAHLFNGVTEGTLPQGEAYDFIRVGRNLERATATTNLLSAHARSLTGDDATAAHYLEWVGLLKSCTSFEAYCREYTADLRSKRIIEFLLLDRENPRSARFCVDKIEESLEGLCELTSCRRDSLLMRSAGRLRALLDYADLAEIEKTGLEEFLKEVRNGCGQIHAALFGTFIRYSVETVSAA